MRITFAFFTVIASFVGLVSACGGGTSATSTSSSSDAGQPSNWGAPPFDAGACETPTGPVSIETAADVATHLAGTWLACGTVASFVSGTAGVQILADGTYYDIDYDAQGHLVRHTGFGHQGWVGNANSAEDGAPFSLGWITAGGTEDGFAVALSSSGTTLSVGTSGSSTIFVATNDPVTVSTPEPSLAHEGAAGCTKEETSFIDFASAADVQSALVGTWVGCGPGVPGGALPLSEGITGITFGADGSWALTMDGADGGQVATMQSSEMGTYTIMFLPGTPEAYATVTLVSGDAVTYDANVQMAQSPLKVMFGAPGEIFSAQ